MTKKLPLLEYDLIGSPSPTGERPFAFTTTRLGGVSEGFYGSFNINTYCGDTPEHIAANKKRLARRLHIPATHILMPHQVHGDRVKRIDEDFLLEDAESLEGYDAMMTWTPGICIGVSTADCTPILLYDAKRRTCAAVHAGWRGTVKRIVQKTIERMGINYATEPQDLHAVIGPCISIKNFEVGDEVYEAFANEGFDMNTISKKYEKWHIDLPECNRQQLLGAGVPARNITVSPVCTFMQSDSYFSARRLGIQSGRIFTAIIIHP